MASRPGARARLDQFRRGECNEDDDLPLLMAKRCHRVLRTMSTGKPLGKGVERALGILRAFTFSLDQA